MFLTSAKVVILAMVLVVPIGTALGLALARWDGPKRGLLDALVVLPLVLPPSVTGYYLLAVFGKAGAVGAMLDAIGIRLVFDTKGAALAAAVVAMPLMAKGAEAAFLRIDRGLEEVARVHGMSPRQTFAAITLPLAAPGLVIAITIALLRALGEFGATLLFAGYAEGKTNTAPLELWIAYSAQEDVRAQHIALGLTLTSIVATLVLAWVGRRARSEA
jgi:molybdate transport system permease protein